MESIKQRMVCCPKCNSSNIFVSTNDKQKELCLSLWFCLSCQIEWYTGENWGVKTIPEAKCIVA